MTRQTEKRVVITGLGVISALGNDTQTFWHNLLAGRSGVSEIEGFDTQDFDVHIAAQIKDFRPEDYLQSDPASYGRTSQLAIAAVRQALADSGLDCQKMAETEDICLNIGTTMGETDVHYVLSEALHAHGLGCLKAADAAYLADNIIGMNINKELDLTANYEVFNTACAAGNYAIGHGFDQLRSGRADIVLAGGADAFSRTAFIGFARMLSLAPQKCQPFDKDRQGLVIGEGAAFLVLEGLEHASRRGARIYGEIAGYGLSCDARHMTTPAADGIALGIENAMANAQITGDEVDLICAHGTGTSINDITEYQALRQVLGARVASLPTVAIKSMLGHAMGAASALESVCCILSLQEEMVPPTINLETPDEACPLNVTSQARRVTGMQIALNNAFAFGNNNCITVFKRFQA